MRSIMTSHSGRLLSRRRSRGLVCALAAGAAGAVHAASPPPDGAGQEVQDAWLDGHLEAAYDLNEHLGPFPIDVQVEDGLVRLSGRVESEIERDLALEIARATQGVEDVESSLAVDGTKPPVPGSEEGAERTFGQRVHDATASARVKRNLAANGNTKGLAIEVATENDVVTLRGAVTSRKDKMLVEMIARNTDGIASVRNQLEVNEPT